MSRPRKSIPSYLPHAQSGKARAVWTDQSGNRQFRMLPGLFDSQESCSAFARLQLELAATPHQLSERATAVLSMNEMLVAYLRYAEQHYQGPDKQPTDEIRHLKTVCRYLKELYGLTPAKDFGPLALKAVCQKFIAMGWCRTTVNARIERVRRVFRRAVAEEMIPPTVHQALAAVTGLQRGRTTATETTPIELVDDAIVDVTLQYLNRHVRGLVEFQRLTGCRPREACRLRRCDIDMGGTVWQYRPPQHKGSWRGKARTISIGPKAQALLREFFTTDINDYLFSPARAVEELRAERSAKRKTPQYPSHMKRNAKKRKAKPQRTPTERYNRGSYEVSVDRACDKAFPPPEPLAKLPGESQTKWWARLTPDERIEVKAWQKTHRWSPNQLRHTQGTKVRKEFGLEAAGAALGHSKMSATEVYAERDAQLAATVAAKIG